MSEKILLSKVSSDRVSGGKPPGCRHAMKASDFPVYIDCNGRWFYQGSMIEREKMVRLFSRLLRKEGENFYIVTPTEKLKIRVEDMPFTIISINRSGQGVSQNIHFQTSVGDALLLDREHPLKMKLKPMGTEERGSGDIPCITVRGSLEARVSRNVYYELANMATKHHGLFGVWSHGKFWALQN